MAKQKQDALTLGARYTGDGSAWVSGVPARDLTPDEWLSLSEMLRNTCLSTGLYELVGAAAAPDEETDNGR